METSDDSSRAAASPANGVGENGVTAGERVQAGAAGTNSPPPGVDTGTGVFGWLEQSVVSLFGIAA
jgi:hypothetical protein